MKVICARGHEFPLKGNVTGIHHSKYDNSSLDESYDELMIVCPECGVRNHVTADEWETPEKEPASCRICWKNPRVEGQIACQACIDEDAREFGGLGK